VKSAVDLIPREVNEGKLLRRRAAVWLLVCGVALAAVVFVASSLLLRVHAMEAQVAPLREQVAEMRAATAGAQELAEELRAGITRQQGVSALLEEPAWNAALSDIAGAINDFVWVELIRLEQTIPTPGAEKIPPSLLISGTAASTQDLIGFMAALADSPRVDHLGLRRSQAAGRLDDPPIVEFSLEGVLPW